MICLVKNGIIDSFEYVGDNIPYNLEDNNILEPEFTSISNLYQKISDRAKEEKDWWKNNSGGGLISTTLNVKYDPQLNYITFFEPNDNWKPGWIVDTTNHATRISNFIVLDN